MLRYGVCVKGLSKRTQQMPCTEFAVSEVEVFLHFQFALGRFLCCCFGGGKLPPLASLDRGLERAYQVRPGCHSYALLAVAPVSAVVSSQSLENKKGEETTARRKAVLFAWLMSSLKTYAHVRTSTLLDFFFSFSFCRVLFG